MQCRTCGTQNPDNANICSLCGASLNQTVQGNPVGVQVTGGFQAPVLTSSPAAAPQQPLQAPMTIAGSAQTINYLIPVLATSGEDPSLAFELPATNFKFMIGRTDLGSGIVPQISVEEKWPINFIKQNDNWLFSRKTAYVRRDDMGQLFLAVDSDCGVVVLMAQPGSTEFAKILLGDEVALPIGATLIFGYKGHGARAVVR